MTEWVDTLFGSGTELNSLQMVDRAAVVFLLALLMIRVSGRRSLGQRRPFDVCVTVLLGAVLSRAVVGASPFLPTVLASMTLVLLHRLIGVASFRWEAFERLVSGDKEELVRSGQRDVQAMRRGLITHRDLDEAVRAKAGDEGTPLARAVLERDGTMAIKPAARAQ